MPNDELKAELFSHLCAELQSEGATEINTEVIEANEVPPIPGRFVTFLSKIGGRFVTLVGKWGSFGFILYVTWFQAVPQRTPIYAPIDEKAVLTDASSTQTSIDLYKIDPSGSADLWISRYGLSRPVPPPTQSATYVPCSGDKVIFVPTGSQPPKNYFQTVTGSFAG